MKDLESYGKSKMNKNIDWNSIGAMLITCINESRYIIRFQYIALYFSTVYIKTLIWLLSVTFFG
jgi:hypothetical protein